MSTLQELITEKTRDELLAEELTVAQSEGLSTTSWQSGSVIRTILVIVAHVLSIFSSIIVEPIKGGFGDLLSSLSWAKLWAKETFNVDHVGAEPATGTIDIVNASATVYNQPAGDLIVAHATTGKLYRNTALVTVAANATTVDVPIASVELGTSSNAAPGAITVLVGPAMDGVTITNPLAVLGADDETRTALINRARAKLAALSPLGPKEAYNYIAKTPEFSATSTPITRSVVWAHPLTGEVDVYIATASGAPSGPDVAIVQAAIEKWAEPWCTIATAAGASNLSLDVTYEVWVKSGLLEAQIKTAIEDAIVAYFASVDIGGVVLPATTGKIYIDGLEAAITGATLDGTPIGVVRRQVTDLDGAGPVDKDVIAFEVPVLSLITGTVNFL